MKITVETTISAPPDIVFATVADIPRWPDFIRPIHRIEILTSGPIGIGTRFRETRTMFGRRAAEDMTVAEIDAPLQFVLTAENHGVRYRAAHEIDSRPGGSQLRLVFEGTPVTNAAKVLSLIGRLLVGPLKRQLQADLDDVKAEAERRARN